MLVYYITEHPQSWYSFTLLLALLSTSVFGQLHQKRPAVAIGPSNVQRNKWKKAPGNNISGTVNGVCAL